MSALSDQLRRAIGAPPPASDDRLQALRASIWDEVEQAEQQRPDILRALRDQQQSLHNQGLMP